METAKRFRRLSMTVTNASHRCKICFAILKGPNSHKVTNFHNVNAILQLSSSPHSSQYISAPSLSSSSSTTTAPTSMSSPSSSMTTSSSSIITAPVHSQVTTSINISQQQQQQQRHQQQQHQQQQHQQPQHQSPTSASSRAVRAAVLISAAAQRGGNSSSTTPRVSCTSPSCTLLLASPVVPHAATAASLVGLTTTLSLATSQPDQSRISYTDLMERYLRLPDDRPLLYSKGTADSGIQTGPTSPVGNDHSEIICLKCSAMLIRIFELHSTLQKLAASLKCKYRKTLRIVGDRGHHQEQRHRHSCSCTDPALTHLPCPCKRKLCLTAGSSAEQQSAVSKAEPISRHESGKRKLSRRKGKPRHYLANPTPPDQNRYLHIYDHREHNASASIADEMNASAVPSGGDDKTGDGIFPSSTASSQQQGPFHMSELLDTTALSSSMRLSSPGMIPSFSSPVIVPSLSPPITTSTPHQQLAQQRYPYPSPEPMETNVDSDIICKTEKRFREEEEEGEEEEEEEEEGQNNGNISVADYFGQHHVPVQFSRQHGRLQQEQHSGCKVGAVASSTDSSSGNPSESAGAIAVPGPGDDRRAAKAKNLNRIAASLMLDYTSSGDSMDLDEDGGGGRGSSRYHSSYNEHVAVPIDYSNSTAVGQSSSSAPPLHHMSHRHHKSIHHDHHHNQAPASRSGHIAANALHSVNSALSASPPWQSFTATAAYDGGIGVIEPQHHHNNTENEQISGISGSLPSRDHSGNTNHHQQQKMTLSQLHYHQRAQQHNRQRTASGGGNHTSSSAAHPHHHYRNQTGSVAVVKNRPSLGSSNNIDDFSDHSNVKTDTFSAAVNATFREGSVSSNSSPGTYKNEAELYNQDDSNSNINIPHINDSGTDIGAQIASVNQHPWGAGSSDATGVMGSNPGTDELKRLSSPIVPVGFTGQQPQHQPIDGQPRRHNALASVDNSVASRTNCPPFHARQLGSFKRYECGFCGKIVTNIQIHVRRHTNDKPYACDYCDKRFTNSGDLQIHTRIHTGEKPYGCPICGKSYRTIGNFNSHVKTHDNGERPHRCVLCNETFEQTRDWFSHLRSNHKFHQVPDSSRP